MLFEAIPGHKREPVEHVRVLKGRIDGRSDNPIAAARINVHLGDLGKLAGAENPDIRHAPTSLHEIFSAKRSSMARGPLRDKMAMNADARGSPGEKGLRRLSVCVINPRYEPSFWGFDFARALMPERNGYSNVTGALPAVAALTPSHCDIRLLDENVEPIDYEGALAARRHWRHRHDRAGRAHAGDLVRTRTCRPSSWSAVPMCRWRKIGLPGCAMCDLSARRKRPGRPFSLRSRPVSRSRNATSSRTRPT